MAKVVPRNSHVTKVVSLKGHRAWLDAQAQRLIRLAPELDGLSLLYSNRHSGPKRLFAMKLLCWGLRRDGEVVGMLPWLNRLMPATALNDPATGQFEGYYDPVTEDIFEVPPKHKILEVQSAARYFCTGNEQDSDIVQEIPDTIGTHAMLVQPGSDSLLLAEVLSWRLYGNGQVQAMLVDDSAVAETPVLPGDDCLYPAEDNPAFRYFFQHHIANQIKAREPAAMEAIALLLDG